MASVQNDEFSITTELEINSENEDDLDVPPQPSMSHEAMMKLYEMRLNNQHCDAVIHCLEDDKCFNIHRPILSACSLYFEYVQHNQHGISSMNLINVLF